MLNRKFNFLDANTSVSELVKESTVNFMYGFISTTITVFMIMKSDIAVLINFLIYFMFVSIVINRDKYDTKVGKYMIFPAATTLGAFLGYELAFILTLK